MTVLPKRFRRNTIANYVSSAVTIVLALVVTPVLVRGLGQEAYGVWALATTWVLYFNLLQLGTARATVKFVAEADALGDRPRVVRTVATSFWALAVPGFLLVLAVPGLAYIFPVLFDVPDDLRTAGMVLVVLATIDMAIAIPADTFGAALAGYQRYDLLAVTVAGTAVAQAAAWTVIVALDGGLVAIGVATIVFSLVSQLARFFMVRYLAGENPIRLRRFDRGFVRPLMSMSGWIAVAEFSAVIIGQLDVVIVGLISGVVAAGVYAVGLKLSQMPSRLTGPMTSVFFPHAAELAASGRRDELRRMMVAGTRIAVGMAAPLAIAIGVLAEPTIDAWVGSGFEDATLVVVYLSAAAVATALYQVPAYVLRGIGDVKLPAFFGLFEAVVNLSLSVVLALAIGPSGVALATLIARVLSQVLIAVPYACRRTESSVAGFFWEIGFRTLPASAAALGVGLVLVSGGLDGLLQVTAAGLAIIVTYTAVMLVTGVTAPERRLLFAFVGRRIGREAA
jgi:O-antigen/teichoic acid export membrane protein